MKNSFPIEYLFETAYNSIFRRSIYPSGSESSIDFDFIIARLLKKEGFLPRILGKNLPSLNHEIEGFLNSNDFKVWIDKKIEKADPEVNLLIFLRDSPKDWNNFHRIKQFIPELTHWCIRLYEERRGGKS